MTTTYCKHCDTEIPVVDSTRLCDACFKAVVDADQEAWDNAHDPDSNGPKFQAYWR